MFRKGEKDRSFVSVVPREATIGAIPRTSMRPTAIVRESIPTPPAAVAPATMETVAIETATEPEVDTETMTLAADEELSGESMDSVSEGDESSDQ